MIIQIKGRIKLKESLQTYITGLHGKGYEKIILDRFGA